ncbi:MAG: MFS transporter [Lachnospiraceae bacterium]|nr:MFS transporter [Lachnospiraceae bacterium]
MNLIYKLIKNKSNNKFNNHEMHDSTNILIKQLNHNILLDYAYSFINSLNMSSSIWVLYLAYRGMSLLQIGMLEGIFHIASMLFEVPSGSLADLFGRKKTMIAGRICMAISCIVMLFARTFPMFALGFVLHAWSYNFNSGAEEALVYDSLKHNGREEEYPVVNGRINFCIELAQGIATVAGGILAERSYTLCYAVCFIIAVLSFIPVAGMKETPREEDAIHIRRWAELFSGFFSHFIQCGNILKEEKKIRKVIIIYASIFTVYSVLLFYSQQYFFDLGLNKIQISAIMLLVGIASCIGALISNKIYEVLGNKVVKLSICIFAVSLMIFGQKQIVASAAFLVISGFFQAMLYPIQSDTLNRMIPSAQRATIISVNSMAFSVCMVLLFPIAGAMADVGGLENLFLGLGIIILGILPFAFRSAGDVSITEKE